MGTHIFLLFVFLPRLFFCVSVDAIWWCTTHAAPAAAHWCTALGLSANSGESHEPNRTKQKMMMIGNNVNLFYYLCVELNNNNNNSQRKTTTEKRSSYLIFHWLWNLFWFVFLCAACVSSSQSIHRSFYCNVFLLLLLFYASSWKYFQRYAQHEHDGGWAG